MQTIAERAGVNKALLHYYFRSKDKLYESVLSEMMTKLWTALQGNLPAMENLGHDLRTLLRVFISTFITMLRANPDFPRMFLRELADGFQTTPRVVEQTINSMGNLPERIFGAISAGIGRREVKPIEPPHIIFNIIGMCASTFILQPMFGVMYQKVMRTEMKLDEEFYQKRIDAIVEMVCEGIFLREKQS